MAERAGDAVGREIGPGPVRLADREVGEDRAGLSRLHGGRGGHRHVAARALSFDFRRCLGMVHDLAPHGRLEVGVAGAVGHHRGAPVETDRDVGSIGGRDSLVAGDTAVRGAEVLGGIRRDGRLCPCGSPERGGPGRRAIGPERIRCRGTRRDQEAARQRADCRECADHQPGTGHRYHPSKKPPSNQSRRR